MSCLACNEEIDSSYVVINSQKFHRKCEILLQFCDTCCYKAKINGECLECKSQPKNEYHCEVCKKIIQSGELNFNKLLCLDCIKAKTNRKMNYIHECFNNDICYKCAGPTKTIKEERYKNVVDDDTYTVISVRCVKCGILKEKNH